ncbi:hypothetical protein AB0O67_15315 [Streptomyces sp. NPDC086077]|uniref:hypothetical protein n=1 Tax=Streptomyces sp. NPDC086077 TaxID=3154862 RepID=UPI00341DB133
MEGQPRGGAAASPPPTTNPFQAPDFGDDENFLLEGDGDLGSRPWAVSGTA